MIRRSGRINVALALAACALVGAAMAFADVSPPARPQAGAAVNSSASRRDMVDRALRYLASQQRGGMLGDSRQRAVTGLYILACLSSGTSADDVAHGAGLRAAGNWLAESGTNRFLGGDEEPNSDHAIAGLALLELVGQMPDAASNRKLMELAQGVVDHSLKLQEDGANVEYTGGWRRSPKTRANDRVLSAWYLLQLRAASLCGIRVPRSSIERATDFIAASQKMDPAKGDELGGFSVDFQGLAVRHSSGAGIAALAFDGADPKRIEAAVGWFDRHPPRWYGPQFFESSFFSLRGLYRARGADEGRTFANQLSRIEKLIRERQEPDGSVPFPPGHSEPLVAMGKCYSTAMAVLILNVDRGFLPVDQDETAALFLR